MPDPTLAVCIPAYNEAEVLPRVLASVRAQAKPYDEVWVYDDCSKDDTGRIAMDFGAQVIRGKVNVGCSGGKNVLAERTHCDWVHFLDADDALLPGFVERAHQWMNRLNPPEVVLFNYDYREDDTNELVLARRFDRHSVETNPLKYAIRETIPNVCIYRRKAFLNAGGFDIDPDVLFNEDVALHTRLAIAGLRFAVEETPSLLIFRRRASMSSASANRTKVCRAQYNVLSKISGLVDHSYRFDLASRLWEVAASAAQYSDYETADKAVALATRLYSRLPPEGGRLFSLLCTVSPSLAVRIRERLIRWFKPWLRR